VGCGSLLKERKCEVMNFLEIPVFIWLIVLIAQSVTHMWVYIMIIRNNTPFKTSDVFLRGLQMFAGRCFAHLFLFDSLVHAGYFEKMIFFVGGLIIFNLIKDEKEGVWLSNLTIFIHIILSISFWKTSF